jgi:hypothetical protein
MSNTTTTITIPSGFEQVAHYIQTYSGNFTFILDLRNKLNRYKQLSLNQWIAAAKAHKRDLDNAKPSAPIKPIPCQIPITIAAHAARKIAKEKGWKFNPMTLLVHEILGMENNKLIKLRVSVNWTGNVTSCRCCGKPLSDWRSQATGVGPVCVKHLSIPYVKNQQDVTRFQLDMEKLCESLGVVEIDINRYHLGNNSYEAIANLISKQEKITAIAVEQNLDEKRVDAVIKWLSESNSLNSNANMTTVKLAITNILKSTSL